MTTDADKKVTAAKDSIRNAIDMLIPIGMNDSSVWGVNDLTKDYKRQIFDILKLLLEIEDKL